MIAITVNEDGDIRVRRVTDDDVLEMDKEGCRFLDLIRVGTDPMYWASAAGVTGTVAVLVSGNAIEMEDVR